MLPDTMIIFIKLLSTVWHFAYRHVVGYNVNEQQQQQKLNERREEKKTPRNNNNKNIHNNNGFMRNKLFATSMIWNNATSSLDMLDIEHIYYNGRDERAKRTKHMNKYTHTHTYATFNPIKSTRL